MTKYFPSRGKYEIAFRDRFGTRPPRFAKKLVSHFKAHAVCGTCNGGWMNKYIESAQHGPLANMIDRTRPEAAPPLKLSVREQRRLALWAAKVAMLYPYTLDPPIPADPRHLRALRRDLRAPRGTYVWVGSYTMKETYCHFYRLTLDAVGPLPKTKPMRVVGTTFVLGHAAFRVVQGPPRSPYQPPDPDPLDGPWYRLWPTVRRSVVWPTPGWNMNLDVVEHFAGGIPTRP